MILIQALPWILDYTENVSQTNTLSHWTVWHQALPAIIRLAEKHSSLFCLAFMPGE